MIEENFPIINSVSQYTWEDSQKLEMGFWGTCANTYGEETKQLLYMSRMGFNPASDGKSPFSYDGGGLSYVDIGGGPVSILLKFRNTQRRMVVDPCQYPDWTYTRYWSEKIETARMSEELLNLIGHFDVALIYNVLQHVQDPRKVIENALRAAKTLHVFEWVDMPSHPGHPHCLTRQKLEEWTGLGGEVEEFNGINECYGRAWYV